MLSAQTYYLQRSSHITLLRSYIYNDVLTMTLTHNGASGVSRTVLLGSASDNGAFNKCTSDGMELFDYVTTAHSRSGVVFTGIADNSASLY